MTTNRSFIKSKSYLKALEYYNIVILKDPNVKLVKVTGYKGDITLANQYWQEATPDKWTSFVVLVGDKVYDLTPKQFGENRDFVYDINQLNDDWEKQEILK